MMRHIGLPLSEEDARSLCAGDSVYLTGPVYTGRDAAHRRMSELIDAGQPLPVDLMGQTIYYVGPAPASPGHAVGPAGPTTSSRMDGYTPKLLRAGLRGMIGKGMRSEAVVNAMRACGAVYFGAVGGAAAVLSKRIVRSEVVAYEDLGTEAIHRFWLKNFPVMVLIDTQGNNFYEIGPREYLKLRDERPFSEQGASI